jgi:hypothetical protein
MGIIFAPEVPIILYYDDKIPPVFGGFNFSYEIVGTSSYDPVLKANRLAEELANFCRKVLHRGARIFLSHSWNDKLFARRLATDLQDAGAVVWIDEAEIGLGDSLIEKIRQGIDQVDYVGVLLSSSSSGSGWVQKEVDIAMNQEIEGRRVKVLPLLLEAVNPPWFLKGKLFADFTDPSQYQKGLNLILQRLGLA